jgi:hypothetical protein
MAERLKQKAYEGPERDHNQYCPFLNKTGSRPRGAVRDACHVEQQCLALLMSAHAMGAMFESRPQELGCDEQNDLTARGKASIRRRSGVASGECTGRTHGRANEA